MPQDTTSHTDLCICVVHTKCMYFHWNTLMGKISHSPSSYQKDFGEEYITENCCVKISLILKKMLFFIVNVGNTCLNQA